MKSNCQVMINTYGVVIHALEINFDWGFLTECFIYLSMAICSLKGKNIDYDEIGL